MGLKGRSERQDGEAGLKGRTERQDREAGLKRQECKIKNTSSTVDVGSVKDDVRSSANLQHWRRKIQDAVLKKEQ